VTESRQYKPASLTTQQIREIRDRLREGLITPEEARRAGFPPADPIEENR
jgi:hypothetical protein